MEYTDYTDDVPFSAPSYVNVVVTEQDNIFEEGKSYLVIHINANRSLKEDQLVALEKLGEILGEKNNKISKKIVETVGGEAEDRMTISGGIETTYRRPCGTEDALTVDLVNKEIVFVTGEEITKEPLTEEGIVVIEEIIR